MRAPHRRVTGPSPQFCEVAIVIVISIDVKIAIGQMRNLGSDLPKVTGPIRGDAQVQSLHPMEHSTAPRCLFFHLDHKMFPNFLSSTGQGVEGALSSLHTLTCVTESLLSTFFHRMLLSDL